MRTLLTAALVGFLGLNSVGNAQNSKEEGRNRDKDQNQNQNQNQNAANAQTIHGVIAGVTVAGETLLNYDTDQATVARVTYLTILGGPGRGQREARGDRARESRENARDSQKNEGARDENARSDNQSDQNRRRWNSVYYVAITPQTRVFQEGEENDKGKASSTPDDQTRFQAAFQKIELGERVVVEFTAQGAPGGRPADAKHGRERTFRGLATSIEILNRDTRGDQRANESSRERSSRDRQSSDKEASDRSEKK
jgi:hypothetical protein